MAMTVDGCARTAPTSGPTPAVDQDHKRKLLNFNRYGAGKRQKVNDVKYKASDTKPARNNDSRFVAPCQTVAAPAPVERPFIKPAAFVGNTSNPFSGELNTAQSMRYLQGVFTEIDQRRALVVNDASTPKSVKKRLQTECDAIEIVVRATLAGMGRNSADHDKTPHRIARDCFAQISKIADKCAAFLPKPKMSGGYHRLGTEVLGDTHHYFKDLGKLANELKRYHYSRAGVAELNHYANIEAQNKTDVCYGLGNKHTGSEIRTITHVGISLKLGLLPGGSDPIGLYVGGKLSKLDRDWNDDDGDSTDSEIVSIQVNGRFKAQVPGCKAEAGLKGEYGTGSYNDYKALETGVKATVVRKSARWSMRMRSGDRNSFGNRFMDRCGGVRDRIAKGVIGFPYTPTGDMPNINFDKMAKGSCNAAEIIRLSNRLAKNNGTGKKATDGKSIHEIAAQAYPSLEILARSVPIPNTREELKTMTGFFNPLQEITGLPSPANGKDPKKGKSLKRSTIGADASIKASPLGFIHKGGKHVHESVGLGASIERAATVTKFMKPRAPHVLLDPDFSKDADLSHELLNETAQKWHGRPKLHSFKAVAATCNAHMSRSTAAPGAREIAELEGMRHAIVTLTENYVTLIGLAGERQALGDKDSRGIEFRGTREHQAKFSAFITEVFGIPENATGKSAAMRKRMLADHKYFIVESYDALSLAFGQVSVRMHDTKKAIAEKFVNDTATMGELGVLRDRVNLDFLSLKNKMDNVLLPIHEETLLRQTCLQNEGTSINTTWTGTVEATAAIASPFPLEIPGNSNPLAGAEGSAGAALGVNAVSAAVALGLTYRNAYQHPNPNRSGKFWFLRLAVKGGGPLAGMFAVALRKATETFASKSGMAKADMAQVEDESTTRQLLQFMSRASLADYTREAEYSLGFQKPPAVGIYEYETSCQFMRVYSKTAVEMNLSVGIPLHFLGVPLTIIPSIGRSQHIMDVQLETMGPSPSYQIMQYPVLHELLVRTGGTKALHQALTDPRADSKVSTAYVLNKWFGQDETILGVLDKFVEYSANRRPIGPQSAHAPLGITRNEFHRFDDDDEFFSVIQKMRSAERYSSNRMDSPTALGLNLDGEPRSLTDARPEILGRRLEGLKELLANARAHFDGTNMDAADRAAYFLTGGPNSNGAKLFAQYKEVMTAYFDIHNGLKSNKTYMTRVVGPDDQA